MYSYHNPDSHNIYYGTILYGTDELANSDKRYVFNDIFDLPLKLGLCDTVLL